MAKKTPKIIPQSIQDDIDDSSTGDFESGTSDGASTGGIGWMAGMAVIASGGRVDNLGINPMQGMNMMGMQSMPGMGMNGMQGMNAGVVVVSTVNGVPNNMMGMGGMNGMQGMMGMNGMRGMGLGMAGMGMPPIK